MIGTVRLLLAIGQKELHLVFRDIFALFVLVVFPILLIIVTSDAFDFILGESGLGVVAVDLDGSPRSEALIAGLRETEGIDLRVEDWSSSQFSRSDAERLIEDADGSAVIVVPDGFGAGSKQPTLYVDPVQRGLSTIFRDRVERFIVKEAVTESVPTAVAHAAVGADEGAVREAVIETFEASPIEVAPVSAAEQRAFPSAFEQSVPGFTVMFGWYIAGSVSMMLYFEKKQWKTWQRALVAPVGAWSVLGSKLFAYAVLGVLQIALLFFVGWAVWDMSLGESPAALLLTMAAVALVSAGFGLLIGAYFGHSMALQYGVLSLSVFALGVIGGAMVPVFLLPNWMQVLSPLTPHYWALDAFQDIMIRGQGVTDILPAIGILLSFAAALFAAALPRFRFVD